MTDAQPETLLSRMQQLSRLKPAGSFVPKLNEGQRIAVFALYKHGATREALAQVFGIHRNSVAHIVNEHSSRYKAARKAYYGMGEQEAFRQYVTASMVEQLEAVMSTPVAAVPKRDISEPDPNARQRMGDWQNDAGEPMEIVWFNNSPDPLFCGPGWYPRVKDNEEKSAIILPAGRDKPYNTSAEAYNAGKKL